MDKQRDPNLWIPPNSLLCGYCNKKHFNHPRFLRLRPTGECEELEEWFMCPSCVSITDSWIDSDPFLWETRDIDPLARYRVDKFVRGLLGEL